MSYRCVATSIAGFIQQLAVGYVTHGYYFYVTGRVPDHKDPAEIDRKLISQYGIDVSKWSRTRRKQNGLANLHYLRFERFFVLLASHGDHPFFEAEAGQLRDIRKQPLHFMGYSIGCRRGRKDRLLHASVRIHRRLFSELKVQFERTAVNRPVEDLGRELSGMPFEPYAPVRDQLRIILRAVNRRRKAAGLELVPRTALRMRRKSRRVFAPEGAG